MYNIARTIAFSKLMFFVWFLLVKELMLEHLKRHRSVIKHVHCPQTLTAVTLLSMVFKWLFELLSNTQRGIWNHLG